jgi:CBS domain-containing protein/ribosome-associated translation inhibitor RaiA
MDTKKILVKDLMSRAPRTVNTGEAVSAVISMMRRERIKELPVLDAGKPVGLVSYTSLIARRSVPLTAKVESIMMPCAKLEETTTLAEAAEELISVGARGAPVVRDGKVIGFLSRDDIVRAVVEFTHLGKEKVGGFMTAAPVSVTERDIVRKAQIIMEELDEKALPVVGRRGNLVGVIGMSEVIDVLWSPKAQSPQTEIRVGSVMNRSPVQVAPDDTLEKVVSLMLRKGLSTIFVTDESKLVGVVDQVDLMEIAAGLEPKKGVYVRISGLDIQEPDAYDTLYGLIEKTMKGINRYESPRVFSAHVRTYKEGGWTNKYSIGARLTTERGVYFASESGWNLYRAMDSVLDLFEGMVTRKEGRRIADVKAKKGSYRDED